MMRVDVMCGERGHHFKRDGISTVCHPYRFIFETLMMYDWGKLS